jgi:spermidine/putrescine transport system substrate-binding protein
MSAPDENVDRMIARAFGPRTRRTALRQAGAGALSLGALAWLAACGGDSGVSGGGGDSSNGDAEPIAKGEIAKRLYFSNWPLYLDMENGKSKTLDEFKKRYGTSVKYVEEINDNEEFFGKISKLLERGQSGGRDIVVFTDWMAARMIRLGYVQRFDKAEMPNATKNLRQALRDPSFDPERDYSMPWQSGMTGIVYRRDLVGEELKSVNAIFDPQFKGKVTMLTEMRDTVGLTMLGMGEDPSDVTVETANAAMDKIEKASKDGQIRRFTGNDYTRDILKGDAVIAYGWSGDAIQLLADNPNVEFLLPDEGYMLWSDNMQIPVGAPEPYTAQKMIDFVYDPKVQANIAEFVNFVTPVDGVQPLLTERDPELGRNPLIFPTDAELEKGHNFKELEPAEMDELNKRFQQVIGA